MVSSAYLRLLIFLLAILIPACASSSLAFPMMYSTYKLNKQGDNIQPWHAPFPRRVIWVVPLLYKYKAPVSQFKSSSLWTFVMPAMVNDCLLTVWSQCGQLDLTQVFKDMSCSWCWRASWTQLCQHSEYLWKNSLYLRVKIGSTLALGSYNWAWYWGEESLPLLPYQKKLFPDQQ